MLLKRLTRQANCSMHQISKYVWSGTFWYCCCIYDSLFLKIGYIHEVEILCKGFSNIKNAVSFCACLVISENLKPAATTFSKWKYFKLSFSSQLRKIHSVRCKNASTSPVSISMRLQMMWYMRRKDLLVSWPKHLLNSHTLTKTSRQVVWLWQESTRTNRHKTNWSITLGRLLQSAVNYYWPQKL